MRKLKKVCGLRAIFFILPTLLMTLVAAEADEISLASDLWCPYSCAAESDKPGILVELTRMAFERRGHTVQYEVLPWARALVAAKNGNVDGILGMYKVDAPEFIFPQVDLFWSSDNFFVKKHSRWKFSGIESLEGVTLGVIQGYGYSEKLNAYVQEHKDNNRKIQAVSGEEGTVTNLRKLLKGRLDVIVETPAVLYHVLSSKMPEKASEIMYAGVAGGEYLQIGFSPNSKKSGEYARVLGEELRKMEQSGEVVKVYKRYGVNEVPAPKKDL